MLRIRTRWHDAANRLLDQEARLLRFAKAGGPGPDGSPVDDDLPPPNAPPEAEANAERTGGTPEETAGETRHRAAETLAATSPTLTEARESNEKVINALTMLSAAMESLNDKVAKEQVDKNIPDQPDAWAEGKKFVHGSLGIATGYRKTLDIIDVIKAQENVQTAPLRVVAATRLKVDALRKDAAAKQDKDEVTHLDDMLRRLDEAETMIRTTEGGTDAGWIALNDDQKKEEYARLNDILGVDATLRDIAEITSQIDAEIASKTTLKMIIEMEKKIASTHRTEWSGGTTSLPEQILHGVTSQWNNALNTLGIEFYTPMQLYMAFQDLKEAFVEVKKQRDRGKASKIAALTGRAIGWLPGMRDVELILETSRTKKDDEVKNGFKEALGASNWQPGFNAMFEPGALLDQNIHDKNRSRAILEYAAGNGMLYDISDETAHASKTLFGRWHIKDLVPGEWSQTQIDSYWDNLRGDNTNGSKKRTEIGEGLVRQANKAEEFIKAIDGVLKGRDIWLAKGMIIRAFDKGRESWMAGWIATTVMNRIQNDPVLRQFIPSEWYDEVGLLSAKTAAFTLGYLNFQRNDYVVPWSRSGERDMHTAGHLGSAIEDVKKDILGKNASLNPANYPEGDARDKAQTALNEMIAKVLTCQAVDVGNGEIVTIFDRRYDYYNNGSGGQRQIDFAKLSEDFFAAPSEILMSDTHVVAEILELTNAGEYKNNYHAKMLFTNAVKTIGALETAARKNPHQKKQLEDAAERFRSTFGKKIEKRMDGLFTLNNPLPASKLTLDKSDRKALMAMVQEKLISLKTMKDGLYCKKPSGESFAETILQQCLDDGRTPSDLKKQIDEMLKEKKAAAAKEKNNKKAGTPKPTSGAPTPARNDENSSQDMENILGSAL